MGVDYGHGLDLGSQQMNVGKTDEVLLSLLFELK